MRVPFAPLFRAIVARVEADLPAYKVKSFPEQYEPVPYIEIGDLVADDASFKREEGMSVKADLHAYSTDPNAVQICSILDGILKALTRDKLQLQDNWLNDWEPDHIGPLELRKEFDTKEYYWHGVVRVAIHVQDLLTVGG